MKLLLDMNLSPAWVEALKRYDFDVVHWYNIGSADAKDREILSWAKENGYVLLTKDLDFGAILAASGDNIPSVIQVRIVDVTPDKSKEIIIEVLREYQGIIDSGALISIDESGSRVRILPIK